MSHVLHISDERYRAAAAMAAERGQTPEQLMDTLVDEAWERACARYDIAFHNDPEWQQAAREAEEGLLPQGHHYTSTEAFFRALGATEDELKSARNLAANRNA